MKKTLLLTLGAMFSAGVSFAQISHAGLTYTELSHTGGVETKNTTASVTTSNVKSDNRFDVAFTTTVTTTNATKNLKLSGVNQTSVSIAEWEDNINSSVGVRTSEKNASNGIILGESIDSDYSKYASLAAANSSNILTWTQVKSLPSNERTYVLYAGHEDDWATYADPSYESDNNSYVYAKISKTVSAGRGSYTTVYGVAPIISIYYTEQTNTNGYKITNTPTTIPAGVISSSVTSISIPASVTTIADGAFANSHINNYQATGNFVVRNYANAAGTNYQFLLNSAETKIIAIQYGATGKFNIPASVTSVAANCLANVSNVTLVSTNTSIAGSANVGGTNNKVQTASATLTTTNTADGKGLKVTGVVTSANVTTLNAAGKSYVDFTEAEIIGALGTVAPSQANTLYYFPANTSKASVNAAKNVVIGGVCSEYEITDNGTEIFVPTDFSANNATIVRSLTAGKIATFILPFNCASLVSKLKPASFTSYDPTAKTCRFTYATGGVAANTPFLADVQEGGSKVSTNAKVDVTKTQGNKSANSNGGYIQGSYTKMVSANFTANDYLFNTNGDICVIGSSNYMNPMRAFIHLPNFSIAGVKIQLVDEDEEGDGTTIEADDIDSIDAAPAVAKEFYTADGKKLAAPQKGMNIVKKTMADGSVVTTKVMVK